MLIASGYGGEPGHTLIRRCGPCLVEFNASGSRCLFSVPDASYRIEGTYRGATQFAIVEMGALTTQLRW